jgi:hypothetical protein
MAEAWKSSGVIASPEPPGGTAYRGIGADGVERNISDLSDWIVAIRDLARSNPGRYSWTMKRSAGGRCRTWTFLTKPSKPNK